MSSLISALPLLGSDNPRVVVAMYAAVVVVAYLVIWRMNPLYSIPTLGGPSAPGLSYITALNFMRHGKEIIEDGYHKYYKRTFKVTTLDQWLVVVSGSELIDDLRKRDDNELSFTEGADKFLHLRYSLGPESVDDPFHVEIIRGKLTRTLPTILPEVIDELKLAVHEYIPTNGDEWVSLPLYSTIMQIVARASNRAFVGLPLCRNREYLDLVIAFTLVVIQARIRIGKFPDFMKPLVGFIVSKGKTSIKQALVQLRPLIEAREAQIAQYGEDRKDKPNDMLQWILDEARQRKNMNSSAAEKVLLVNFAAIHTSTATMTHAIFDLAASPEYLQPLYEEVSTIITAEGWTKNAIGKMYKLDSFIKESARRNGINLTSLIRKVMKDITLCDGTFLPKGTLVCAGSFGTHHDEANYPGAGAFEPFRFAQMREKEGEELKHQLVNTSVDYVLFGHGRHACPGRFFAANELKAMLAYLVLHFEMKVGGDGTRPKNTYYGVNVYADRTAHVLFKARKQSPVA